MDIGSKIGPMGEVLIQGGHGGAAQGRRVQNRAQRHQLTRLFQDTVHGIVVEVEFGVATAVACKTKRMGLQKGL